MVENGLQSCDVDSCDDCSTLFSISEYNIDQFLEWCLLMDECYPQYESRRVFQQFLRDSHDLVLMVNSDLIIFELISIVHHGYIYFQFHWFFRQPALQLCSGENTTLFMFTFVQGELYLKSSQTSKMELLEKI